MNTLPHGITAAPPAPQLNAAAAEARMVRIARELAMDLQELPAILKTVGATLQDWDTIKGHPRFHQILSAEVQAWNSAVSTQERVKLKSAAIIEQWLPEAYMKIHDASEALPAKTELAKLITRLAGLGVEGARIEGSTERFSLTINIGDNKSHGITVDRPMVIDNEA